MKILRKNIFRLSILCLLLTFSFSVVLPALAAEGSDKDITERMLESVKGIDLISGGSDPDAYAQKVIGRLVAALLGFLGIVFFILVLLGGWRWMNARGNDEEAKKAKDIITQAVIGLLVVVSAYAISMFVSAIVLSL